MKLVHVKLGEFDTTTNPDCKQGFCNDRYIIAGIEEKVVHEGYSVHNVEGHHDIALLRLDRSVNNTRFIKPICLPLAADVKSKNWENIEVLGNSKRHLINVAF